MSHAKYFHCYATANDKIFYLQDIRNLLNIKNQFSGIEQIHLYIAISLVKPLNFLDKLFVRMIKLIFNGHKHIILKEIFFKNNLGRDFSSYFALSKKIQKVSSNKDYVFFQNRSAYGPYKKQWYKEFVNQYHKFESIAICGSTINFNTHTYANNKELAHIQTYAFLSQIVYLKMLNENFPGAKESNRNAIIEKGEIGLSQFFLNQGYNITCLEWSHQKIHKASNAIANTDIKKFVTYNHPFYHRTFFKKTNQIKNKKSILAYCKLVIFSLLNFKKS